MSQPDNPTGTRADNIRRGLIAGGRSLRGHWGWMLGILLIALGVKFRMILASGGALAYYDQWEGEAADLYVPWFEHQLSLANLFAAHNEHRIFFTRVYDLALLWLNQQWDSQLQMTGSAVIHAAIVAGFGWLMVRLSGMRIWPVLFPPLTLALALPFAWENTLWGFQSQFYFLLLFSLLTIWLLGLSEPRSSRWRLGVFCAVCALFTMATGFLALVAVAVLDALDILKQPQSWRRHIPTLAVCAVLSVAGWLLKARGLDPYVAQAHSPREFFTALGSNLAWPSIFHPWLALLNLLPLLLLGWLWLRTPGEGPPAERMILGVGAWVGLQSLAAAYARGVGGQPPHSRYMDTSSFLMLANWLSIILLLARHRPRLKRAVLWYAVFLLWTIACASGLWRLTEISRLAAVPSWTVRQAIRTEHAQAFIATDDERCFQNEEMLNLPFPYVPELVFLLREPDLRRNLPACVRDPLKVLPAAGAGTAFIPNGCAPAQKSPPTERCWGSYSSAGTGARGSFESLPIRKSALPFLEIPVAGNPGALGMSLELTDLATGKDTPVRCQSSADGGWRNAYIMAPGGEFKVVARDESDTQWFAFKEPREVGRLSYWAVRLLETWKYFLGAGLVCTLSNFALLFRPRPHDRVPAA